jgi:hypothetical protein
MAWRTQFRRMPQRPAVPASCPRSHRTPCSGRADVPGPAERKACLSPPNQEDAANREKRLRAASLSTEDMPLWAAPLALLRAGRSLKFGAIRRLHRYGSSPLAACVPLHRISGLPRASIAGVCHASQRDSPMAERRRAQCLHRRRFLSAQVAGRSWREQHHAILVGARPSGLIPPRDSREGSRPAIAACRPRGARRAARRPRCVRPPRRPSSPAPRRP